jgi:hypothetical protein
LAPVKIRCKIKTIFNIFGRAMFLKDKNAAISRNSQYLLSILVGGICGVFLFSHFASASEVTLAWDPVSQPEVSGYRLYYGTLSGRYHTSLDAGDTTSYKVSNLAPGTYFFAVTAYIDPGEESDFSNEVQYTVIAEPADAAQPENEAPLVFPRFSFGADFLGEDTMTGLSFVNLDPWTETLRFTALDCHGILLSGPGISNPTAQNLNPRSQLPIIDWQVFGSGLVDSDSDAWAKLESTFPDTYGTFLIFNSSLTLMGGAGLSDAEFKDFVFTAIQTDGANKISIINSNPESTTADIYLVRANGTVRSLESRAIAGNGALTAELFRDLFAGIEPDAGDYVRVESAGGLRGFQVMRQNTADIAVLAGQDAAGGGMILYSPLYVQDGFNRTSLSVVNLDARPGILQLRLMRKDGMQLGATRTHQIPANGKLHLEDPGFFLPYEPPMVLSGYVEIESDGIRLAGNTFLGEWNRQLYVCAMELVSSLQTSVLFNFVISDDVYYTGLALLNPNPSPALVAIEVYAADGDLLGSKSEQIEAGESDVRLLTQHFPFLSFAEKERKSGYIRLRSTLSIASIASLGTNNASSTAIIPAQVID